MVLQELAVKRGVSPPVYALSPELTKQGTHKNKFVYRVQAFDTVSYGRGSSKQIAKQDGANCILQLLQKQKNDYPAENPVQHFLPDSTTLNNNPIKTFVNYIGNLRELCEKNNIPQPQFEEISYVGGFTFDCIVSSIRTRATASTKKQTKQLATKDMLERIIEVLPDLLAQCNPTAKQITETDEAVVNTFFSLSLVDSTRKPDYCRIRDYDLIFKKIIDEKEINLEDLKQYISDEYIEENFISILEKLELSMTFTSVGSKRNDSIIVLTMSTKPSPFSSIAQAESEDEAKEKACKDAYFKMLKWLE